jgi:protein PsiE
VGDKPEEAIDGPPRPSLNRIEESIIVHGFHAIERILLILVAAMTLLGAASEVIGIWRTQQISLADILLMFIYTEVIGMVSVFYTGRSTTFVFPIFIAITALARLIILQGKEMAPENIVFEASAILLLTLAAMAMLRTRRL